MCSYKHTYILHNVTKVLEYNQSCFSLSRAQYSLYRYSERNIYLSRKGFDTSQPFCVLLEVQFQS